MKFKKGDIVKYDVDRLATLAVLACHRGVVLETSQAQTSQAQKWRTMLWSPQVLIRWATIDEPEWVHAEAVCLV
jgi:hypothetical protein